MSNNFPSEPEQSLIDQFIEKKLLDHLLWSLIFFCFSYICHHMSRSAGWGADKTEEQYQKRFIKRWRKLVYDKIVKPDVDRIHKNINTPKSVFKSILSNPGDTIDSTEIYLDKYNGIM